MLEATAAALRIGRGVDAQVSFDGEPDLTGFDAVHLFGLTRPQETWVQARNARRQGKPVFLSTIYCDVWEFERRARSGPVGWIARHSSRDFMEALKAAGRGVNSREWGRGPLAMFVRGYSRMMRDVAGMAAGLLPNSHSEWVRVAHDLDLDPKDHRVTVVPCGYDGGRPAHLDLGARPPSHLAGLEGCVLCVAVIEGRKNQLNLIEACGNSDLTLVLAGPATANQTRYVQRVKDAASERGNVHLLGKVSEDEKAWLYSLARVHVLPSWMETTGLSSLEAAIARCSIVVTPNGDTRDYFGPDAEYCDPSSPDSIREAILRARARGPSDALADRIRREFTWERAAAATHRAYCGVLEPS